jgi:hypothetical protein
MALEEKIEGVVSQEQQEHGPFLTKYMAKKTGAVYKLTFIN